jgi:hypothetical protein
MREKKGSINSENYATKKLYFEAQKHCQSHHEELHSPLF